MSLTGQEASRADVLLLRSVAAGHAKGAFARQSNFFEVTYWTAGRGGCVKGGRGVGGVVGGRAGGGCQSCCSYVKSEEGGAEQRSNGAATSGRPTLDEVT